MTSAPLQPLPPGTRARVVAVVRPFRLDQVMEALGACGPRDVLIEQVRGYGRQKGHLEEYEDAFHPGGFLPKVRLEFTLDAAGLGPAVDALRAGAHTGRIGDGKIFVHRIETARP